MNKNKILKIISNLNRKVKDYKNPQQQKKLKLHYLSSLI